MAKRWTTVGTWFGPSKRQLRRAAHRVAMAIAPDWETERGSQRAVRAVRENRLRNASPEYLAKIDAELDELFGKPEADPS